MNAVRNTKGKKENKRIKSIIKRFGFGALELVILIAAAFFAPKLILEFQDNVRCGKVVLSEAEEMDITSFNTGYEKELYKRLFRFAEELEEGQQFYVASQEMEDTAEIEDFLKSEKGLYRDEIWIWMDYGAITENALFYPMRQCRQYVIYGDDFSNGMNFILWYVELGEEDSTELKLLIDAETWEFYGISIEVPEENLIQNEYKASAEGYNLRDLFSARTDIDMLNMWYALGFYYGGQKESEIFQIAEEYGYYAYASEFEIYGVDAIESPYININSTDEEEKIQKVLENLKWEESEDKNCIDFLFPYSKDGMMEGQDITELRFRVEAEWSAKALNDKSTYFFKPQKFIVGFPEIYERIPEFSE